MSKTVVAEHPAPYSPEVLSAMAAYVEEEKSSPLTVLDPFAGIGRIHDLRQMIPGECNTVGIELEPEWARHHPYTLVGDATSLPFLDNDFDIIATSPCFANRMSDKYNGKGTCQKCSGTGNAPLYTRQICPRCGGKGHDTSKRRTYTTYLGRLPSENSAAVMQWGDEYRSLHKRAWRESIRVLRPGGAFILNIKDHQRQGKRAHVTDWHCDTLIELGLNVEKGREVNTRGYRYGQNGQDRYPEYVIKFRK